MKRRVCCFLLGLCILCLPAQQVFAAPAGLAAQEEEKKGFFKRLMGGNKQARG